MSTWATRRKTKVVGIIVFSIGTAVFVWLSLALQVEPTCFDGIQNQGEAGVDCGGPCPLLCAHQVSDVSLLWSRTFPVTDRIYNAVAYVENPNIRAGVLEVPYRFRFYDSENSLIAERSGRTFIANNVIPITPIFAPRIDMGTRVPVRTEFEFTAEKEWRELVRPREVSIRDQRTMRTQPDARVEARVVNEMLVDIHDVEVVAVVFDTRGNAIAASQTLVPTLRAQSSEIVFFVWPRPFSEAVGRVDIIPRIPPRQSL